MTPRRGGFDLETLRALYGNELRLLLRDKRTLLIAVIAPLLLFPLMIFGGKVVDAREKRALEATVFRYAVTGTEADLAAELVAEALALPVDTMDGRIAPATFEPAPAGRPDSLLHDGEIHVIVEGLTPQEWWQARVAEADADGDRTGPGPSAKAATDDGPPVVPVIRLKFRENSDRSSAAARRMAERLEAVRQERREADLATHGLAIATTELAVVDEVNVASAEKEGGAKLGLFLTPILVMLLLTGGSIVAVDAIAGEKERGTLEVLLTTAASRGEIVASKQLAVITVGVVITVINAVNLFIYLVAGVAELPASIAMAVDPAAAVVLFLLFLPVAVLMSSALLLLSGYSKSYKEFQIYFFPVFLLFMIPSFAAVLPGLTLRSAVAVVPLANVSVAVREVLTGRLDWPFLLLAFTTTSATAGWMAKATTRFLSTERLISAAELEQADLTAGAALFARNVLRWFAVLWAVFLMASLWMQDLGIRGQVLFNLVGLFLGGSILMIRRYRLDPREALALRLPHPSAWVATVIGAPSALIVGIGLSKLAGYVIPVPEKMLESFGQFLLPETMSLWQIIFFLAVMPGICEEIAFRGVLLHGLRQRLSPIRAALVVGTIFGLFHVSLFRIIPTGYLGVIFAGVVLMTGSIYPAMLWHALNNGIALVPGYLGWWDGQEIPTWAFVTAVTGLALAIWILWRWRVRGGEVEGTGRGEDGQNPISSAPEQT